MFPSHVMGTFGTNRIYTVCRVVKVEDLMRFGGWLRAGSIPSVSQMQNSSAGVSVNHRIPSQGNEDGFSLKAVPLYGGTITTPDGKTMIIMEYAQHTWRLPRHLTSASQNQSCCRALLLKILLTCVLLAAYLSFLGIHSTF